MALKLQSADPTGIQPSQPNEIKQSHSLPDELERLGKLSVLAGAILYGIGLLVTNEYLLSLGISDFNSLRPKYLITGTWTALIIWVTALPTLLTASALIGSVRRLKSKAYRWPISISAALLTLFLSFYGTAFILHIALLILRVETFPTDPLSYGLIPIEIQMLVFKFFGLGILVGLVRLATKGHFKVGLFSYFLLPVVAAGSVVYGTLAISKPLYHSVPAAFGGGQAIRAVLILNTEGVAFWKQTGAAFQPAGDSTDTGIVAILYQNDNELVILVKANHKLRNGSQAAETIVVDKKLVNGIRLIDEERGVPGMLAD